MQYKNDNKKRGLTYLFLLFITSFVSFNTKSADEMEDSQHFKIRKGFNMQTSSSPMSMNHNLSGTDHVKVRTIPHYQAKLKALNQGYFYPTK